MSSPKSLSNVDKFKNTREYLDNGATGNTSIVIERTSSIVLNTQTPHYTHMMFRKVAKEKTVRFETSYVYSMVYEF